MFGDKIITLRVSRARKFGKVFVVMGLPVVLSNIEELKPILFSVGGSEEEDHHCQPEPAGLVPVFE